MPNTKNPNDKDIHFYYRLAFCNKYNMLAIDKLSDIVVDIQTFIDMIYNNEGSIIGDLFEEAINEKIIKENPEVLSCMYMMPYAHMTVNPYTEKAKRLSESDIYEAYARLSPYLMNMIPASVISSLDKSPTQVIVSIYSNNIIPVDEHSEIINSMDDIEKFIGVYKHINTLNMFSKHYDSDNENNASDDRQERVNSTGSYLYRKIAQNCVYTHSFKRPKYTKDMLALMDKSEDDIIYNIPDYCYMSKYLSLEQYRTISNIIMEGLTFGKKLIFIP